MTNFGPNNVHPKKVYLGDGAYAEINKFKDLILYTSDGIKKTNKIVIESDYLENLLEFIGAKFKEEK